MSLVCLFGDPSKSGPPKNLSSSQESSGLSFFLLFSGSLSPNRKKEKSLYFGEKTRHVAFCSQLPARASAGGIGFCRDRPGEEEESKGALGDVLSQSLDCYWVGSVDFNFLVEINPPKVKLFAGGSTATKIPPAKSWGIAHDGPLGF